MSPQNFDQFSADRVSEEQLIAHLLFNEALGIRTTDSSPEGSDNLGRLRNGAAIETVGGDLGGVVNLDGSNDYIQVTNSADINLGTHAQRTVSVRFKVDDKDISDRKQVIYEEGGAPRGLNIYIDNGSLYVGGWNRPASESKWLGTYLSTDAISSDTWHHVTLVLNGDATLESGAFSAYLDGVKFGEGEGSQLWEHTQATGIGALIGNTRFHDGTATGTGTQAFGGSLDDLRVYNQVLTDTEISILANPVPDLVAHLEFEDISGIRTIDTSPYGNNNFGRLRNGAIVETVGGEVGDVVSFDGTNDHIQLANSTDINLGVHAQRTVSIKFKVDDKNIADRKQVIYDQGHGGRGLNIYIDNGSLYVGGWNRPASESKWLGTYLSTDAISSDTWHHVTLVLDGDATLESGAFSAYLDGAKFGEGEGSQLWEHTQATGIGALIGNTRFHDGVVTGTGTQAFGGSLDDLRIYNRALTEAEIADLAGTTPPDPNPNQNPALTDDTASTQTNQPITLLASDLLSNDSDPDGDALEMTAVGNATNGTVALDDEGNVEFTPEADFSGDASFNYTVSDGQGGTATATVNVSVNASNQDPRAIEDTAITDEDVSLTLLAEDLLYNDFDSNGDTLEITEVGDATNGTVALDDKGNVEFIPEANFNGNASFTYTVSDGKEGTATATVNVTVEPVNDNPTVIDDTATIEENTPLELLAADLLENDSDIDSDSLEIIEVGNAANGTVVMDGNGNISFIPATDFEGDASFTYTVSDGDEGTATATVNVAVTPAPEEPVAMGMNLSSPNYWGTQRGFLDVFKSARAWLPQSDSSWNTKEDDALDLDENGWVRSLPTAEDGVEFDRASALVGLFDPAHGDRYVVLYDGKGTLEYSFSARKDTEASKPGRDVLDVTRTDRAMLLKITSTDPEDYIRNIRIVPEIYEDTYETQVYNPNWLDKLEPFESVRFMDWMATNHSPLSEWSDRPEPDDHVYTEAGLPVETLVDVANRLDADPWFTIPHQATDEYVTNFAEYVKDNLDPDLDIYVEYSNEVWNSNFSQAQWIEEQAALEWPDSTDSKFTQRMDWFSKRTTEVTQIWDDVFAEDKDRVIGVMGAQSSNDWTGNRALGYRWADEPLSHEEYGIDAIAIAPYFGGYIGNRDYESQVQSWTNDADGGLDKLFDELTHGGLLPNRPSGGALQDSIREMEDYAAVAEREGLDLVAYEGGQHLAGTRGVENNNAITELFVTANRDPRMGQLYEEYFEAWQDVGGGLFANFADISESSKWGSWGTLEDVNDTGSPKYDAIIDALG
ncbi:MAG: tandem-95 repeat protein [Cyanobacteriota bacterium]|nr:tandem-95 repeat protein [Cyanobacteriota bacterium]